MTHDLLTDAVTSLDSDILAGYEAYRAAGVSPKTKRRLVRWGALAASFLLVAFAGLWLFLPPGVQEDSLIILLLDPPDAQDYVLEYQRGTQRAYRAEPAILSLRKGEFYMENDTERFYRVKGTDDLAALIGERKDTGKLHLYKFVGFSLHMFYEEEERPMPSLGEVWSIVYGVEGAEDIRRVTFEQIHVSCPYEREIPIPEVTLTAKEDIARFYDWMRSPTYEGYTLWAHPVECTSPDYLAGKTPLTVQTARRVTVEFGSGESMKLDFYAADGVLRLWNYAVYALSDTAAAWLTDVADIDLAYRDHGTVKEPPKGAHEGEAAGEVATLPIASDVTETETPMDIGHTD